MPIFPKNVISCKASELSIHLRTGEPVYLTIDTDGFDPAIMPAVTQPVARGLSHEDFAAILVAIELARCPLVGIDWVEFNPSMDSANGISLSAIITSIVDILRLVERTEIRQFNHCVAIK